MSYFVMKSISRVVPNGPSSFNHRFGGTPVHRGIKPRGGSAPLHLLYTFDTKDPLVPLRIPRVRYLPLYYSFVYNAGAVGYQVVSDDEIKILYMETTKVEPNFPYENYPAVCRRFTFGTMIRGRAGKSKPSSKSAQSAARFMRATGARDQTL